METKTILILDSDRLTGMDTEFLLQLSGYRTMRVSDPDEALNWIGQLNRAEQTLPVLLVNQALTPKSLTFLEAELERLAIPLSFLWVDRTQKSAGIPGNLPMNASGPMKRCPPDEILHYLQEMA